MNGMGSFAPKTLYARLMLKPLKKHWNKETVSEYKRITLCGA